MEELVKRYAALGIDRSSVETMTYALAEQIHQSFCVGFVAHSTQRPDQHLATLVLTNLFDSGWVLTNAAFGGPESLRLVRYDPPEG